MPPKKKHGKKKDAGDDGDQQQLAVKAFQKGIALAYADHGVEPLNLVLDQGEAGTSAFLRLAVHPALGNATAYCSPLQVRALAESLAPYPYLQRLVFWSVAVRDEGVAALASFLSANRTVVAVEATDCGLGVPGCKHLGEALVRNKTLTSLKLDHNPSVGAAGAEVLGACLVRNVAVNTVSLTFCGIESEAGACALADGLLRAQTLKTLALRGNRLGAAGVSALLGALRLQPATLFSLDVSDTGFGGEPEVVGAIEECFEQNVSLSEYGLRGNHVGDSCAYRWLGMVRRLPHLIDVAVSEQVDPLLFKQIADAAAANKKDYLKRMKKGKGKGKGKKK